MQRTLYLLIRVGSYPLIAGCAGIAILLIAYGKLPYWPNALLLTAIVMAVVALLERMQPYQPDWLHDHQDTLSDILHALFSISLIFLSAEFISLIRLYIQLPSLWPDNWPVWLQLLIAGLVIDFGLWLMHRLSHQYPILWRLHALHHSAERIYWLNGERRHPLSALVLAAPGIVLLVLLGTPALLIGCWLTLVAVHLAFQHANLDYTLGPLKHVLASAEAHRWHHKRGYGKKNLGEFWLIWDHLFGSYHAGTDKIPAHEVGLNGSMPKRYLQQLVWPFRKKYQSSKINE